MKIKKCSYCGNWTGHTGSVDDICEVCNNHIDIQHIKRQEKIVETSEAKPLLFYMQRDTDNFPMKIMRYILSAVYFVIMGIMSFIIWLVAALPG